MPYSNLPPHAFWSRCRASADFLLADLYRPKIPLAAGMRVATAGSCFAQHIGAYIRASDLSYVDVEPAPKLMPQTVANRYGYGLFSARYGNIYTARQLRQLIADAVAGQVHQSAIWQKADRYYDALRPNIEPDGFLSEDELRLHRQDHLLRIRQMLAQTDVFVFTLGLTECWTDTSTGVTFPVPPGIMAGVFSPDVHAFTNLSFQETLTDLAEAIRLMRGIAPDLKILLTVSPVPLTATQSGDHVLSATTYSKSVLRAVAGEIAMQDPAVDYFPSYEMITGAPFGAGFYDPNLRNVSAEGVATVMAAFFGAHDMLAGFDRPDTAADLPPHADDPADDLICEEALLEAFARS